jgi:hypothetical protein
MRAIALSCLLSLFFAFAAWGQDAATDWTIDNFRWREEALAPAGRIVVVNKFGDVRLRAADAGEVEVSAMIQRPASEAATAEVKIKRRWGRLVVEVAYPAASRPGVHRVDIAVFVPAGAPVAVRTRDGLIQARGLASAVKLKSAGGDVVLSTTGAARVSVGEGDITATLDKLAHRPSRLATRKGDISLHLPDDADAQVKIEASGKISVQRPAEVEHPTARTSIVTLRHGTHHLSLRTRQGGVTLLAP